jgi:transposase
LPSLPAAQAASAGRWSLPEPSLRLRHLKIDHQKLFSSGRVYIKGLEGFWSWAKERLMNHHGISKARFPLYIKELEFRYNHRTDDLFDLIANCL